MSKIRQTGCAPLALAIAAVTVVLGLGPTVGESSAAPKRVDSYIGSSATTTGTTGGLFNIPRDVAVNESTGDVYVVDSNNHRIQQFNALGLFVRAWGRDVDLPAGGTASEVCTVALNCKAGTAGALGGQFSSPQGIAIDQSTGAIYVSEQNNLRVQKFDGAGNFLAAFGRDADQPAGGTTTEICTVAASCKAGASGGLGGEFASTFSGNLAVNPVSGNLLVADPGNRRAQEFDATGAFVRAFGWDTDSVAVETGFEVCTVAANCKTGVAGTGLGQFSINQPARVAVDASARVYALDTGGQRVQRFDSALVPSLFAPDVVSNTATVPGNPADIAVDPASQNVVVAKALLGVGAEWRLYEVTSAGDQIADSPHMSGAGIRLITGMTLTGSSGRIYVSSNNAGHRVYLLDGDGASTPSVDDLSVSGVGSNGATFQGTVNPNNSQMTTRYHFEYAKSDSDDWTFAPAVPVDVGNGTTEMPVTQTVTGIEANQEYKVRLVAVKAFNAADATSAAITFTTTAVPPLAATGAAFPIRSRSARLVGSVNANNSPTAYRFEYGLDTSYGSSAPATARTVSGGRQQAVSEWVEGLEPETTYHFRIVAEGDQGTDLGADQTFRTGPAIALAPSGRAYEMVTPADKASRRLSEKQLDGFNMNPGLPSADGEVLRYAVWPSVIGEPKFAFAYNLSRAVRTSTGWRNEPHASFENYGSGVNANVNVLGMSDDFANVAASPAAGGTQVMVREQLDWPKPIYAYPNTYFAGRGWSSFLTDPSQWWSPSTFGDEGTLFTRDGDTVVRFGPYRGRLGSGDPSLSQLAGAGGGATVYRQDSSGEVSLVSECTGSGSSGTQIPAIVAGKISAQPCEAGAVTSSRGAVLGARGQGASAGGTSGGLGVIVNAISDEGDRVFFASPDPTTISNVDLACSGSGATTSCPAELYIRQTAPDGSSAVRWVSRSKVSGQDAALFGGHKVFEGAATDGSKVFFRTNAPLTADDPNGTGATVPGGVVTGAASGQSWDLYQYDLPADPSADPETGTLTRITGGPSGDADPNASCSGATAAYCDGGALRHVSHDGSRVYFTTAAPIPGVSTNDNPTSGSQTTAGGGPLNPATRNLYLYDSNKSGAARWEFIAQLPFSTNAGTGALSGCATSFYSQGAIIQLFPADTNELQAHGGNCMRGTADGRAIAFMTDVQLTPDDTDAAYDVYLYDGTLHRVTGVGDDPPYVCVHVPAAQCNGDLGTFNGVFAGSAQQAARNGRNGLRNQNLDDTGAVYFQSRRALVAEDVNGTRMDTYRWDDGEVTLISPGNSDDDAYYSGNSLDGEDVFFETTQPIDGYREIDPGDGDIYDARIGGGFPPPPPGEAPCEALGGRCQGGGAAVSPTDPRTGVAGDGNVDAGERRRLALTRPSVAQRRRAAQRGTVALRVRSSRGGRLLLTVDARLGGRTRRVGRRAFAVARPGVTVLRVRLNRAARRKLRAGRALPITVRAQARGARPASLRIVLRRAGR